jgi:starch phosphorylase
MLRDYVVELYGPAAVSARAVGVASGYAGAKELASWREAVTAAWPNVRVAHVESGGVGEAPEVGQTVDVRAVVTLGGLSVDDVSVEVVYGAVDDSDAIAVAGRAPMSLEHDGAQPVFVGSVPLQTTGPFGYTVRILPRHRLLSRPSDLALVRTA